MADVRISELPALSAPADADVLVVVDDDADETKKLALGNLKNWMGPKPVEEITAGSSNITFEINATHRNKLLLVSDTSFTTGQNLTVQFEVNNGAFSIGDEVEIAVLRDASYIQCELRTTNNTATINNDISNNLYPLFVLPGNSTANFQDCRYYLKKLKSDLWILSGGNVSRNSGS